MSVWILLVVLVIAPLSLLIVRCAMMLASFLGLRHRDAVTEDGGGKQVRASAVAAEEATALEPRPEAVEPEPLQVSPTPAGDSRACSVCGAQVLAVAHICRHCGAALV